MSTKPKDPICGASMDPAETRRRTTYSGADFYFCSDACMKKFNERPGEFVTKQLS